MAHDSAHDRLSEPDRPLAERAGKAPTPAMAQFLAAKAAHPDALLFYRMGDFYELFFEDAEKAATALDIALTSRGEHDGKPVPMAGVPVRSADVYLDRLIRAGFRVAVCEQMEDPAEAKKRGSKAVVRREVVRIVTPGTLTEETLLEARSPNRLCAAASAKGGAEWALAWADISTGEFAVAEMDGASLGGWLTGLAAGELVASEADLLAPALVEAARAAGLMIGHAGLKRAHAKDGERRLEGLFGAAGVDALPEAGAAAKAACGALIAYVEHTQAGRAPALRLPERAQQDAFMAIDPATRASLEITQAQGGGRAGSLLGAVDRTTTAGGARLLADRLARPSGSLSVIEARLDAAGWFLERGDVRRDLRSRLRAAPDMARALGRIRAERWGPRDLRALGDGLKCGEEAAAQLLAHGGGGAAMLEQAARSLTPNQSPGLAELMGDLRKALVVQPPPAVRDGGAVEHGFHPGLDALRELKTGARRAVAKLQADYAEETGAAGLRIKHNNVLGYFLECSPKQAPLLTDAASGAFRHRQTLASAVRFTTERLETLEAEIASASERALALEREILDGLAARSLALAEAIDRAGDALAQIDVAAATAEWAEEAGACRPEFDPEPVLIVDSARHPAVEAARRRDGEGFTPNGLTLDARGAEGPRLLVVTGPNMAGKSTYLRQAALLAIMAQAGLFVPALSCRLGMVDRIFSRVGAQDDLSKGRSTFMTEMVETAQILHRATERSLVVLDEVGRGTATYDGLAIAWATAEHLHGVNRCRALFATHYHELAELAEAMDGAANAHLRAREWGEQLVFLHEVASGPADRSYGVQVARLAGLPRAALKRAAAVLADLEAGRKPDGLGGGLDALPLFAAAKPAPAGAQESGLAAAGWQASAAERLLDEIDPDALTPREALELIYELKAAAGASKQGD